MSPIVSIVIVEYKSIEEIQKCVLHITEHLNIPHEIIISSNSCYDENTRKTLISKQENARWVFNERNGGFAYAMNCGLEQAEGEYLVIMNSDCIINADISPMIEFMKVHPDVGAIAPQIRDEEENIQDTARPFVTLPRFAWRQIRRIMGKKTSILSNKFNYDQVQTVDWLIGAFIMVSRKAYELTQGLDDSFFMYAEDIDWCTRIRIQGLNVVYYPKIQLEYKGTRRARTNKKYAKIFIKSHMKLWKKWGFIIGPKKHKEIKY